MREYTSRARSGRRRAGPGSSSSRAALANWTALAWRPASTRAAATPGQEHRRARTGGTDPESLAVLARAATASAFN